MNKKIIVFDVNVLTFVHCDTNEVQSVVFKDAATMPVEHCIFGWEYRATTPDELINQVVEHGHANVRTESNVVIEIPEQLCLKS